MKLNRGTGAVGVVDGMEIMSDLKNGWYEEYGCGCVSEVVSRKSDLPGYCGKHGHDRRGTFRMNGGTSIQTGRRRYRAEI